MKTPEWFLRKNLTAYALLPLGLVYYFFSRIIYCSRLFCKKKSKRPVICIGNILAGGVGKTPIVIEVAKYLKAPVVMRGYKKCKGTDGLGDEAKMLKSAGINVLVGNRAKSVAKLNKQKSKLPIVMDDGFQNPLIKKNLSILVFDENIGLGNGFLLPAGPLREPVCAVKRADAIIVIKRKSKNAAFDLSRFTVPVFYARGETVIPKTSGNIMAFAGIGYPDKFFESLRGNVIYTKSFPDHHRYTKSDLDKLFRVARESGAQLVTTEKDWVRLPDYARDKIKFAKLNMVIEPAFWKWLRGKIK